MNGFLLAVAVASFLVVAAWLLIHLKPGRRRRPARVPGAGRRRRFALEVDSRAGIDYSEAANGVDWGRDTGGRFGGGGSGGGGGYVASGGDYGGGGCGDGGGGC